MNTVTKNLLLSFTVLLATNISATQIDKTKITSNQIQQTSVTNIKRQIAKEIAVNYSIQSEIFKDNISYNNLTISSDLLQSSALSKRLQLKERNNSISVLKGFKLAQSNLVQLRLADNLMIDALNKGKEPLFAFEPAGNDKYWKEIEAFDMQGNLHTLDVVALPTHPTFIVELDTNKTLKAGLSVMRSILKSQSANLKTLNSTSQDQPISTSVLKKIRLNDDEEPWISGNAEVYGIVTGVNPSRDEPVLDILDMPYLDTDNKDYHPNQIIIHWERYRWQAADMILMEQDDNTNYKTLASKLLEIAEQVMKTIPDPEVQGYAIIPKLTNELLKAMPDDWFTNDDDYLDVFYTLFEDTHYSNYYGASTNAKVTIEPLRIDPR
ncbi:DUF3103 domain-containing protein [Pseudoalteromonas sp. C2R02]|uniref:DUF3103 family protein n=1 Tax=Pseudoalteromonas sp. C2R02 TaxID=2841565 RepID=UPI001C09B5DF|nr:DUF3103 family protein [Pseudoalteromonas sp. C2R02]MBU2968458.1 DUF3103 domain-containing protein [Pseudoalteromonas sp. C2R02]